MIDVRESLGAGHEWRETESLSVGQLARMAGVSVRTLQYYDRQRLLVAGVDSSGRRRYERKDILRLEQILFFKSFGFSLADIKAHLIEESDPILLQSAFVRQRRLLEEQAECLKEQLAAMDDVVAEAQHSGRVSMERLMLVIELRSRDFPFTSVLNYLSDMQIRVLKARGRANSRVTEQIEELADELLSLYRRGVDPNDSESQSYVARWWNIVQQAAGSDMTLLNSLLSAGADINHWTRESRQIIDAMRSFLASAFHFYFAQHGMPLPNDTPQEETRPGDENGPHAKDAPRSQTWSAVCKTK